MLWIDGLDVIRVIDSRKRALASKALETSLPLQSLHDIAWYCEWKGVHADAVLTPLPSVQVLDLLVPLGIPQAKKDEFLSKLSLDDKSMLQQIALDTFLDQVADLIDGQLPGLGIQQLHKEHELFVG